MSKLTVFCCVLLSVVISGNFYEFDDVAFNQLLAGELEEISHTDNAQSRFRRDVKADQEENNKCRPPPWRQAKLCCWEDLLKKMITDERDLKKACFKEITGKDKPEPPPKHSMMDPLNCEEINKHKEQLRCVFQCMGLKKNLIDAGGNMKENEISKYIKEKIAPTKLTEETQNHIADNCIKEAKNSTRHTDQSKVTCNPVVLTIVHCMLKEIQLNCPDDQIADKEACKTLRENFKKGFGPFGPPPKPPPGEFGSSEQED